MKPLPETTSDEQEVPSVVLEPPPSLGSGQPEREFSAGQPLKKTAPLPKISTLKAQAVKKQEPVAPAQEDALDEPVTVEAIRLSWNAFLEELRAAGRDADYKTLDQEVLIGDDLQIRLELPNGFQLVRLESLKPELLAFLRAKHRNNHIDLHVEVQKQDTKKLIYTAREKFDYLAEKYPTLRELRSKLDLDTDF